jgi:antitoxin component YwqK of YwqJK toxin-antitoxin module
MMRLSGIFFLLSLVFSCGQQPASESQAAFDTTGFALEDIPGAPGYQRAIQRNDKGVLLQEGLLLNGVPEGTWIQYGESSPLPLKLVSFVRGKYDGPYIEYGQQGQIKLRAYYKDNQLDGYWSQFSFGRLENSATYKNGQLDGPSFEYDKFSGKLQKEIHYKDGKLHGSYRFFNDVGEVTAEYEYRDGEKISGGMVGGE